MIFFYWSLNMTDRPHINYVTLYTAAVCNLKCEYCYICKNKGLEIIDSELAKCYEQKDYFFNMYKNYVGVEGLGELRTLHLMGGEPLLKAQRVIPAIETFVANCRNLDRILIYSNFAHDNVLEPIKLLNEMLGKYSDRRFEVEFQISIDGPADINDKQRGAGVTEKIIANLKELATNKFFVQPNLLITVHPKSTIDPKYIDAFLDKDYVINYYKFFEDNFYDIITSIRHPQIQLGALNIPIIATPWEATQEDGKKVAKLVEVFNEIDHLNHSQHIFRYYNESINWFYSRVVHDVLFKNATYSIDTPYCPFGSERLSLLPDNQLSGCHRVFTDYCEDYLKDYKTDLINRDIFLSSEVAKDFIYKDAAGLQLYNKKIKAFNKQSRDKSAYNCYNLNLIKLLAKTGQIDPKYESDELAFEAFKIIHALSSACAYNNIIYFGHEMLNSTATYKLYLNGVVENIIASAKSLQEILKFR